MDPSALSIALDVFVVARLLLAEPILAASLGAALATLFGNVMVSLAREREGPHTLPGHVTTTDADCAFSCGSADKFE